MSKRRTVFECDTCGQDYDSAEEANRCARDDENRRDMEAARVIWQKMEDELSWRVGNSAKAREIYNAVAACLGEPDLPS